MANTKSTTTTTPAPATPMAPSIPGTHGPIIEFVAPDGCTITYRVDADVTMLNQMALGAYQSIVASAPHYPRSPATGVSVYGPTRVTIIKVSCPSQGLVYRA